MLVPFPWSVLLSNYHWAGGGSGGTWFRGRPSAIEQCNRFNLASFLFGDSVVIHSLAPKDFSTHNCFSELDAGYASERLRISSARCGILRNTARSD